jgi:hypothetical protein
MSLLVSMVLLYQFAFDFIRMMPPLLSLPFVLLVVSAIIVASLNLFVIFKNKTGEGLRRNDESTANRPARFALLCAVPLGFVASSLDCSGLSLQGCTPFCTFIKLIWIPAIAIVCLLDFFKEKSWLLLLISLMAFVPLVPHCLCYNVGNGWWIDHFGASPMCYAWGFVVTLIAASAIKSGNQLWLALLLNGAIIGGAFTFFISHHYFHFPW